MQKQGTVIKIIPSASSQGWLERLNIWKKPFSILLRKLGYLNNKKKEWICSNIDILDSSGYHLFQQTQKNNFLHELYKHYEVRYKLRWEDRGNKPLKLLFSLSDPVVNALVT